MSSRPSPSSRSGNPWRNRSCRASSVGRSPSSTRTSAVMASRRVASRSSSTTRSVRRRSTSKPACRFRPRSPRPTASATGCCRPSPSRRRSMSARTTSSDVPIRPSTSGPRITRSRLRDRPVSDTWTSHSGASPRTRSGPSCSCRSHDPSRPSDRPGDPLRDHGRLDARRACRTALGPQCG